MNAITLPRTYSGELPRTENQTSSDTCVRFGLAKAITNCLHTQKRIDVKQSEVTKILIQQTGNICGLRRKGDKDIINTFNNMVLVIQDRDNLISNLDG